MEPPFRERFQAQEKCFPPEERSELKKSKTFILVCDLLHPLLQGNAAYSCFEKGCPTKPYATMPKGIMGNESSWTLIEALGVSATEGNSTN